MEYYTLWMTNKGNRKAFTDNVLRCPHSGLSKTFSGLSKTFSGKKYPTK